MLCRSAMIQLTRCYMEWNWSVCESYFISRAAFERAKKKQAVIQILAYLLKTSDWVAGRNIKWTDTGFTSLGIVRQTAKNYVGQYNLRDVATRCIRPIHKHENWIKEFLHGCVVTLDPSWSKDELPRIAERGRVCANFTKVDVHSVGRLPSLLSKVVQYRKIVPCESNDRHAHAFVQTKLKSAIATALNNPIDEVIVEAAFLRSPGHGVQLPHVDFAEKDLQKLRDKIYIGLTPLSCAGSFLQVWTGDEYGDQGEIVYIPFGYILLLPGDTVHAGGFQSCSDNLDLRIHFYVYLNAPGGLQNKNIYLSTSSYPPNAELLPGGLVHRIFTADEQTYRHNTGGHGVVGNPEKSSKNKKARKH